ncbi:MAG: aminotransferase class V-fold PLP-dependent enzyme [Chloroflexia bacterium]|nr:aminotransferase class V-fold PLP-dependent enzyme [Chloroflexia bacterium]
MRHDLFPDEGSTKIEIFDEINELCSHDYQYAEGKILNSICTSPVDIAKESYLNFIETNLGDTRLFPGVAMIEEKTIKMLGSLVGNPDCYGTIISGGTEANLLALYVARELFYKRKSKNIVPEIIAPKSAHFSIEKVCKILNLKPVFIPLFDIQHAGAAEIEAAINENTAAIIATAGTSELGAVDNIPDISRIANKYKIYFHVDAASGGFLIPLPEN